jgi:hypothetical protein
MSCQVLVTTRPLEKQIIVELPVEARSRDSAFGIVTGYGLYDRGVGVRVPVGSWTFSSPQRPDRFCGSPSLLSGGHRGLFPRGKSDRGVKLTIHLHPVPKSRIVELYLHSLIRLHGVVLN